MGKDIRNSLLLDFYSNLLTQKQREIMSLYIECDTGLSEIASIVGSSRQAVYETIKVSEKLLNEFESKLGSVNRYLENRTLLFESINILDDFCKKNSSKELELVKEKIQAVLDNQ